MKRKTIYKIIYLTMVATLLPTFSSCTDSEDIEATPKISDSEQGSLSIRFSTGGSSTRASNPSKGTVDSNSDLNEDKISRLDLFVIDDDNISDHKYISVTTSSEKTTTDGSGTLKESDNTWILENYDYTNVDGKTVYLVANWTNYPGEATITTNDQLQKALTSDNNSATFVPNNKQDLFFMDGKISAASTGDSPTLTTEDENKKDYTLKTIYLSRAVAKIRLAVYLEKKPSSDPTAERVIENVTDDVSLRLVNYAYKGTVVADNSDTFAKSVANEKGQTSYDQGNDLTSSEEDRDFTNLTENITGTDIVVQYNGEDYYLNREKGESAGTPITEGFKAAVFYVYPNDWIDMSKACIDGVWQTILDPFKLPIVDNRRTSIQMVASYNDGNKYYYTVPVNYQIPTLNDNETVSDYSDLYRIERNHVYDIVAFLDRQGYQNGLYLDYNVSDWTRGSEYTLSDVKAEMTLASGETLYKYSDENTDAAIKVAYDAENQTQTTPTSSYSPKLTIKVSGSKLAYKDGDSDKYLDNGIGDKPWIIHTDNPYFGFLQDGATEIVDQITCTSNTESVTFQLVPKVNLVSNPAPKATVYVTVISSAVSGEIHIDTASEIPVEGNRIVYYQVAPDNYNTTSGSSTSE